MNSASSAATVAYLAPEIPSLSATFVCQELLAVERHGIRVVPISVHSPVAITSDDHTLIRRVTTLYTSPHAWLALTGAVSIPTFGKRALTAFSCLVTDVLDSGILHLASWKLVFQFLVATKLARIVKRENCAHLHVHFADTPAQIAMYAAALTGVPFTITAHANDIFEHGLLLKKKAQRARRMLTISQYNQRYLERLGIEKSRLAVVRCGVSFLPKQGGHAGEIRGPFKIGSLGRLVEKKGFDVLLRSIARLHATGHEVELRLAGDGPLKDELEALARQLQIESVVRFEGSIGHDKVAGWIQQVDAFVLACKQDRNGDMDGIPVVLMEAMSQGIPVISTRLSGVPELVVDGETGLLAEPGDSEDLARQIARLMTARELRAELSTRALAHVMQEFGQATNIARLLDHFNFNQTEFPSHP